MASIRAGQLNKRVTLARRMEKKDDFGAPVGDVIEPVAQIWAKLQPITFRAQERLAREGNQLVAEADIMVTIRYRDDVTAGSLIQYGQRNLEVASVSDPMEKHEALELLCVKRTSG